MDMMQDLVRHLNRKNLKEVLINRQFRLKIKNFVMCNIDYLLKNKVVRSYPYSANLNTTNICNLRCKFCEIHYFYKKAKEQSGKVFPNYLDVEILKNHSEWLKYLISLGLSGATGEPFTNPHILEVIHYLKKYNIKLSMDTNGLLIDEKIAEQLIKIKFDSLSVSIHAGDSKTYTYLQGGDFNRVISNLENLLNLKKQLNNNYPRITINFALNRENTHSVKDLMKLAKDIGVHAFCLYHYYDSRNAFKRDISFYFDVETCNKLLRDTYDYARNIGLRMIPAKPLYLSNLNEGNVSTNYGRPCKSPWTAIKFKGSVEYENCEYICICNRILLFRIDYKRFYENKENSFLKDIWNHPVLQFFRETVNSKESNPICKFCRDPDTPKIRCLDNVEYSHRRDKAIRDFFVEFRKRYDFDEIEGLTVLNENPYKYDEKDGF